MAFEMGLAENWACMCIWRREITFQEKEQGDGKVKVMFRKEGSVSDLPL